MCSIAQIIVGIGCVSSDLVHATSDHSLEESCASVNLDCLVDDGAVLLGVLFLVDHRLILGLVVGGGRQGRRVMVHCMGADEEGDRE